MGILQGLIYGPPPPPATSGSAFLVGVAANLVGLGGITMPAAFGVSPAALLTGAPPTGTASWPPDGTGGLTTLYGTHGIYAGTPPPPVGTLQVQNTAGVDGAHTYLNVTPSNATDSIQTATSYSLPGNNGLQALFARCTLQATPGVTVSGYRFDFFRHTAVGIALLRLHRIDAGVVTPIAQADIWADPLMSYYTTPGNTFITFHMTFSGGTLSGWLSAPGQPNTPVITASGANTAAYPSGRIGFISFVNNGGVGGANNWTNYQASWST